MSRKRKDRADISRLEAECLMRLAMIVGALSDAFDEYINALPGEGPDVTECAPAEYAEEPPESLECCNNCQHRCAIDTVIDPETGRELSAAMCDVENKWHAVNDWCPVWPIANIPAPPPKPNDRGR